MAMNINTLPPLGIASYDLGGGDIYVFNSSTATTNYDVDPKKDAAGRTFPTAEHRLTLRTYLSGTPQDQVVQSAIAILTQPAGILTYTGHGVGALEINAHIGSEDCNFGPWPQVATCTIEGGTTTQLDWTVTFTKPTAPNSITSGAITEYCYQADVSIDSEGYSTRDVKGFYRIPMTRDTPSSRSLRDCADLYREKVVPPIPVGFTRINQHFSLDYSKQQESFAFTDLQMNPTYPAVGVLTCKAHHSWVSEGIGRIVKWVGTLEGEYTVAAGVGADVAFAAFMNLMIQRGNRIRATPSGAGLPLADGTLSAGDPAKKVTFIPLRFSFSEPSIYGPGLQKVNCSVSYRVAPLGLSALINNSGLWQPVTVPGGAPGGPGAPTTWNAWMQKAALPLGPRGTANIVFSPNDDSILDGNEPGLKPTVAGAA